LIIEDFSFDMPKTKKYAELLVNLGVDQEKTMLVLGENNPSVILSARNLNNTSVVSVNEMNVYNILDASKLIISESALKVIKN
jgi:large subunit ribosomal protein L4